MKSVCNDCRFLIASIAPEQMASDDDQSGSDWDDDDSWHDRRAPEPPESADVLTEYERRSIQRVFVAAGLADDVAPVRMVDAASDAVTRLAAALAAERAKLERVREVAEEMSRHMYADSEHLEAWTKTLEDARDRP